MIVGSIATEKRGRNVALFGLFTQIVLSGFLLLLLGFNRLAPNLPHAESLMLTFWLLAGGCILWITFIVIYQQRYKVAQEALEVEELKRSEQATGTTAIFETDQEEWLVARRRLLWIYRWILPFFVVLAIGYLLIIGLVFWGDTLGTDLSDHTQWGQVRFPTLSMFFMGGLALLSFLLSRYLSGMSREPEWRMFKSCSIYLFGNAAVCLAVVISLMLQSAFPLAPRIMACAITVLFVVLGVEMLINFVLDFYRPRQLGEPLRPAFESRLLGLISEPGGIARSIADAVNYQFGFDVSSTWFYRMMQESVVRLVALAVIVLGVMTSFTVIDADEQAYIERWGRRLSEEPIGPGLSFKAPWPMDKVRKDNVRLVQQITVGEAKDDKEAEAHLEEVITWTKEHGYVPSVDVLVATKPAEQQDTESSEEGRAVPVSVLRISMPVQYRIKSHAEGFKNYLYNYRTPKRMLRDIAYRELVKQAVTFDYEEVMSTERGKVAETLRENIQLECDRLKVGVDIVFVGLQEVHPPTEKDVARTFQAVATAQQQKETVIRQASIDYTNMLVEAAGDKSRAEHIYALLEVKDLVSSGAGEQAADKIREYVSEGEQKYPELGAIVEQVRDADQAPMLVEQLERHIQDYMLGNLDQGITPVRGRAGEALAIARNTALEAVSEAAAKWDSFELERSAFQASGDLYKMRKALDVFSEELNSNRKYVIMVDPETTNVIIQLDESEGTVLDTFDR